MIKRILSLKSSASKPNPIMVIDDKIQANSASVMVI